VYERILVGTDGSPTAAKAVDRAAALAASLGARLTVVSVGQSAHAEAVVASEKERIAAAHGLDVEATTAEGDPSGVLIDMASGFDLLVVGNKGMTGASRFFLGSVPNKVSHHAPCSLLIVHTT
jgi:nucleotide-binding universal stress UspA family protein